MSVVKSGRKSVYDIITSDLFNLYTWYITCEFHAGTFPVLTP